MLHDILRETPAYQEILAEWREEGLGKGMQQGREEGREEERQKRVQSLSQKLLDLVQVRFPKLKTITKRQLIIIKQPETLEDLIVKVALSSTAEEVKDVLITWEEPEDSD